MLVLALKALHVLTAMFFLGGGIVIAYYKVRADRSGDPRIVDWCQREIVRADWTFTVPSGVLLPATGLLLVHEYGIEWDTPWVLWGIGSFAVTGLLWLPAAFLQVRMRKLAARALADGAELPPAFHRANRAWLALGVPAFAGALLSLWVMIAKWSL